MTKVDRTSDRSDFLPVNNPSLLRKKRSAVASGEPEDAVITGMTRSLDRRLLALNLQPMASRLSRVVPQAA